MLRTSLIIRGVSSITTSSSSSSLSLTVSRIIPRMMSTSPAISPEESSSTPKHPPSRKKEVLSKQYPILNIHQAVTEIKAACWAKFDESIEISVNTGLDPRKPNQSVKGVAKLPNGTGKKVRVCVIARDTDVKSALEAGADVAGAEDVIAAIQAGDVNFNSVIATPEMMPLVGKIGKILGPRGLMPSPKMGTVTKEITKAVKGAKAGAIQFKVEKKGIIQAGVGKKSFTNEALLENIRAFMIAVQDSKPEGFKGKYLRVVHISSTMGPGIEIDLPNVDPSNPKFMLNM